jgi:hypothetical protein
LPRPGRIFERTSLRTKEFGCSVVQTSSPAPDLDARTRRGGGKYIPKIVSGIPAKSRCGDQGRGLTLGFFRSPNRSDLDAIVFRAMVDRTEDARGARVSRHTWPYRRIVAGARRWFSSRDRSRPLDWHCPEFHSPQSRMAHRSSVRDDLRLHGQLWGWEWMGAALRTHLPPAGIGCRRRVAGSSMRMATCWR